MGTLSEFIVYFMPYNLTMAAIAIDSIQCYHRKPEFTQQLLTGLPHHTLPLIATLEPETLPICLPGLIHRMNGLCVLQLCIAIAATLADTLQALTTAPTYTLRTLNVAGSKISPPAMQGLCTLLHHSKSVTGMWLSQCGFTDELVCFLLTALNEVHELGFMSLKYNAITSRGHAALDEYKKQNK